MNVQQAKNGSAYEPKPADASQEQSGDHTLSQPGVAEGLPPLAQHQKEALSQSQPEDALHQMHSGSFSEISSLASPKQPQDLHSTSHQQMFEHDHAPANGMLFFCPEAPCFAIPTLQSSSAKAFKVVPFTQLRAPGAPRHGSAFHSFCEGSPAPPGHSKDPSLDDSDSELKAFLRAPLANLDQFDELF